MCWRNEVCVHESQLSTALGFDWQQVTTDCCEITLVAFNAAAASVCVSQGGVVTCICSLMFTLSDPEYSLLSAEEGILIKGHAFRCLGCCSVCPSVLFSA